MIERDVVLMAVSSWPRQHWHKQNRQIDFGSQACAWKWTWPTEQQLPDKKKTLIFADSNSNAIRWLMAVCVLCRSRAGAAAEPNVQT